MIKKKNPNLSRFFDESKGCTFNATCADCSKPQWVSERIHTTFHGKYYLHNTEPTIMGVSHIKKGIVCYSCWRKERNLEIGVKEKK